MDRDIKLRGLERDAYCRGCDELMKKHTSVIATYSFRNRGMHIFFCLDCAELIGQLAET